MPKTPCVRHFLLQSCADSFIERRPRNSRIAIRHLALAFRELRLDRSIPQRIAPDSTVARNSDNLVRRYVDLWAVPGVHPTNSEFLQSFKMADSQYFTRGMDVVGTVSEEEQDGGWEKTHLIGIRSDIWKPDKADVKQTLKNLQEKRLSELKKEIKRSGKAAAKQQAETQRKAEEDRILRMQCDDIISRRLVLKLFRTSGKRLSWAGTIEQVTTNEIQNSIGSKRTLLSFAVILPRHEFIIRLDQNHRTLSLGAVFSLGYYCRDRMWPICLRQLWGSIGSDFEVLVDGRRMGFIDGVLFALGSDSYVEIYDHELGRDKKFADLLTLFAASVGYHKAMRRSTKRRVAACKAGDWHTCTVESEELSIFKNGRAA